MTTGNERLLLICVKLDTTSECDQGDSCLVNDGCVIYHSCDVACTSKTVDEQQYDLVLPARQLY